MRQLKYILASYIFLLSLIPCGDEGGGVLIFVMDQITGADPTKLEMMFKTALLVEKSAYDENIMKDVMKTSSELIEEGKYAEAEKILLR